MTDKEVKKFYNSGKWKKKRLDILERDHYEFDDTPNLEGRQT